MHPTEPDQKHNRRIRDSLLEGQWGKLKRQSMCQGRMASDDTRVGEW